MKSWLKISKMTVVYSEDGELDEYILQYRTVVYSENGDLVENILDDCCL
jgi:hypothetical protein